MKHLNKRYSSGIIKTFAITLMECNVTVVFMAGGTVGEMCNLEML